MIGSDILCATLEELGVRHVFGVPGSPNIPLLESLRRSRLQTVINTSELEASFAANGYFRASGQTGVLTTIAGPGFTYALSGIAEARLDSAGILYIVVGRDDLPGRAFLAQRIDQATMVGPVAKRVYFVNSAEKLRSTVAEAFLHARSGEPGPVMVEVAARALKERATLGPLSSRREPCPPDAERVEEIVQRLLKAARVLLYVGQGTVPAAAELMELATLLQAPVVTTISARGVLPEDHALCLPLDFQGPATPIMNKLVESSDLVLALGCKMSQIGTHWFGLRIPPEKLIHVDASAETLGANYPASCAVLADVSGLLKSLLGARSRLETRHPGWQPAQIEEARVSSMKALESTGPEPMIPGATPTRVSGFFQLLRAYMPRESFLTTDAGLHEVLARRHFQVLAPRGLIVPSDFQSMGFGVAAAIGAKLACPDRMSVALVGDGGLVMSGMELLTAIREQLALTVIVFSDGHLGLIRAQQISEYGHAYGTRVQCPDWELFARSLGAEYARFDGKAIEAIPTLLGSSGVSILEVPLGDPASAPGAHLRRRVSRAAKAFLTTGLVLRSRSARPSRDSGW
jgi:acetolactate synthase-1/2/3 large subunit